MQKKVLLLLLIFQFAIFVINAQNNEQIRVCWPDGSYSLISFNNSCCILYGENTVNIINQDGTVNFGYDEIVKIDFINHDLSGISYLKDPDTIKLQISEGIVTVSGVTPGTRCLLNNMQGIKLMSITTEDDLGITINLNQFNDNIFILLVGNHSFKIAK